MRCPKCKNLGGAPWDGEVCYMCGYVTTPVTTVTTPVTDFGPVTALVTPILKTHRCPDCDAPHTVKRYSSDAEKQAAWRERQEEG